MRYCFLNINLQGGGAERQIVQLIKHWRFENGRVDMVLLENQGVWFDELPPGVVRHCIIERLPANPVSKILWALQLVPRLRRFFTQQHYDVVITFLWPPTLVAALALKNIRKRPVLIWSVQSDFEKSMTLHADGWLRRLLVKAFLPHAVNHFVAVSQGIKRQLQNRFHIPDHCIEAIPNGIDFERISEMLKENEPLAAKNNNIRIISIGRLNPPKGMEVLLRSMEIAKRTFSDIECYILGDGPQREQLTGLAEHLGLGESVHFVGHVRNPYRWAATSDLFVLPSHWETFGIAIAEAMFVGLPVVATATDGAKDIIEDGSDGLIVPVGDAEKMAVAMLRLIQDPGLRSRLGAQARMKAQKFDAVAIAGRYLELTDRLLTERVGDA